MILADGYMRSFVMIRKKMFLLFFCGYVTLATAGKMSDFDNGVLIFLDDSENDVGAITTSFLRAFERQAGPIIVSASLIHNVRSILPLEEKDDKKLYDMDQQLRSKTDASPQEKALIDRIAVSTVQFDANIKKHWIAKKINDYLYLLLPKEYLRLQGIPLAHVLPYSPNDPITKTERMLSLKVNHLPPANLTTINKPAASWFANYFIDSLDAIFVKRSEYTHPEYAPAIGIYMDGHGLISSRICSLSIEQFKTFLSFLETIKTKVLVYSSCYAAGTNENLIYKDSMSGVTKSYTFPIIAMALTDAATTIKRLTVKLENGKLQLSSLYSYKAFVLHLQSKETKYDELIQEILPGINYNVANTPQIRYPGLPWFSILNYEAMAPIGSLMAATRTTPLDIANFFAKGGKLAKPYAVLLYAQEVPFELIVDTKKEGVCYMPTFVSMTPGNAVHSIKKISSTCTPAHKILQGFYVGDLVGHKIFIIDEIQAPFFPIGATTNGTTITKAVVDINEGQYIVYFTYDNTVFVMDTLLSREKNATPEQQQKYYSLLQEDPKKKEHGKNNIPLPKEMENLTEQATATFAQPMTPLDIKTNITELLDRMPNNSALRIPQISISDITGLYSLMELTQYRPINTHKILWVNNIFYAENPLTDKMPLLSDVIFDITPKETLFLFKNIHTVASPFKDYVPDYEPLLIYFNKHLTLPAPHANDSQERRTLSLEQIASIKSAQTKKIKDSEIKKASLSEFAKAFYATKYRDKSLPNALKPAEKGITQKTDSAREPLAVAIEEVD